MLVPLPRIHLQSSKQPFSLWAPISPLPVKDQGSFGTNKAVAMASWRWLHGAGPRQGSPSALTPGQRDRSPLASPPACQEGDSKGWRHGWRHRAVTHVSCWVLGRGSGAAQGWAAEPVPSWERSCGSAAAASAASSPYRRAAASRCISSPAIRGIYLSHFHVPLRKHHFLSHFCCFLSSQRVFNEMRKRLFLQAGAAWVISI